MRDSEENAVAVLAVAAKNHTMAELPAACTAINHPLNHSTAQALHSSEPISEADRLNKAQQEVLAARIFGTDPMSYVKDIGADPETDQKISKISVPVKCHSLNNFEHEGRGK